MNMNVNNANLFRFGSHAVKLPGQSRTETPDDMRGRQAADMPGRRIGEADSMQNSATSYAESLRAARTKNKDTSLKLKKLRYDFKSISTQILRSKTSANARQVAAKARREVVRLKRQRQGGEYEEEELQSAITHAQAMERVAKKKANHLLEEEMAKVTGGPCMGELEEKEETAEGVAEEEMFEAAEPNPEEQQALEEDMLQDAVAEAAMEQAEAQRQAVQTQMEEVQAMLEAQMEELQEAMQDMTEEMGLEDLTESMFAAPETEMDPADYKLMKIKHRSEEMKAIARADAEYLKALFDRLEKLKNSGGEGVFGSSSNGSQFGSAFSGGGAVVVSGGSSAPVQGADMVPAPGASPIAMPEVSAGFDISV